jgi:hypothetical protein
VEKPAHVGERHQGPRWAWPVWLALVGLLAVGFVLWVVTLNVNGAPGPVVVGVFIDGPVEVDLLVIYVVASAVLATISTALIHRAPENRIGWVLWLMATWAVLTFFTTMLLFALGRPESDTWKLANWLGAWTFVLTVPSSLALMLFPKGSWISPRWRWLGLTAVAGTVGWAITEATGPGLGLSDEIANPYANSLLYTAGNVLTLLLLAALVGTVSSLVLRFRMATPVEKLQVKWVMLGGILQVGAIAITWVISAVSTSDFPIQAVMVGLISTLFVPLSLTVAILRYRLYSIDHLISRSASYLLLTSVLAAFYFVGVIAAQSLIGLTNSLSVAMTTLAVAAVFNPVRRRLHVAMDRRFNRSRFDAENEAAAFADRISSTTAIESLVTDLEVTVERTLAPKVIGVWVRQDRAGALD